MKKLIVLTVCLSAIFIATGQEVRRNNIFIVTDSDPISVTVRDHVVWNSIVYNAGLGIPSINSGLPRQVFGNSPSGYSLQFGADYRKQIITKRIIDGRVARTPSLFAVGAGLGLSHFRHSADFGTQTNGHITGQPSLWYLDVPVYLEIGKPSKTKVKAWGKAGVKGSLLLNDNFTYANDEAELNPFVLWGNVSSGVTIPLSSPERNMLRNTIVRLGVKYDFTLNSISKGSSNGIQNLGGEVGLIYSL
jgi:hypothetical protein